MLTSNGRAYVFRSLSHHRDIMTSLNEQRLRRDRSLCDVTLAVGGSLVVAHKAVLAAQSGYFKQRFEERKSIKFGINSNRNLERTIGDSYPMSPPESPPVKRRRNAYSEVLAENNLPSPVSPLTAKTPPPQSINTRPLQSPKFNRRLQQSEVVVLPGIKAKAFCQILDYIYTSHLVINKENIHDLLLVSCLLQIKGITEMCVKILNKESQWKTSGNFSKKTCGSPTSGSHQGKSNSKETESLLASPLPSSNTEKTDDRNNSLRTEPAEQEQEVTDGKAKETANHDKVSATKEASSIHTHSPQRGNKEKSNEGELGTTLQSEVNYSDGGKQYAVDTSPNTTTEPAKEATEIRIAFKSKEPNSNIESANDHSSNFTKVGRVRTLSDGPYTRFHDCEVLDLRRKPVRKTSHTDERSYKKPQQCSNNNSNNNGSGKHFQTSSRAMEPTSNGSLEQQNRPMFSSERFALSQTWQSPRASYYPEEPSLKKPIVDSNLRNRFLLPPILDPTTVNLLHHHSLRFESSSSHPHYPYNEILLNSCHFNTANDAYNRMTLPGVNVISQFNPSMMWKEQTKASALEKLTASCCPSYDVDNLLSLSKQYLFLRDFQSNFRDAGTVDMAAKMNLSNSPPSIPPSRVDDYNLMRHSAPTNPGLSYEASKHPLKQKLMMSAAVTSTATSAHSSPPPVSRFDPLRLPDTSTRSRKQQCVM